MDCESLTEQASERQRHSSGSAAWWDSVLPRSPAAGLPSRHSPRQGCADEAGASTEGCQL